MPNSDLPISGLSYPVCAVILDSSTTMLLFQLEPVRFHCTFQENLYFEPKASVY